MRLAVLLLAFLSMALANQTFNVTSPGFYYVIAGLAGNNTGITVKRGETIIFNINTAQIHPLFLTRDGTVGNPYNGPGVSGGNAAVYSGNITWVVEANAPASLFYTCQVHGFGGAITVATNGTTSATSASSVTSTTSTTATRSAANILQKCSLAFVIVAIWFV